MKFLLSIYSLSLLAGALASNVLDLDPSNFDSVIGQGKPALVELYASLSLWPNIVQLLMFTQLCTLVVCPFPFSSKPHS